MPLGKIGNIKFSHIIARGESGILLYASNESEIENVSFQDFDFTFENSPLNPTCGGNFDLRPVIDQKYSMFSHNISAFYAQHVKYIQLHDVGIKWSDVKEDYFTNGIEFSDFENVVIDGCTGSPAPHSKNAAAISLENGKGYRITNSFASPYTGQFLLKHDVKMK